MENKKRIWIIANWKSNKNIAEALEWVSKVGPRLEKRENIKVVVCPSFVALEEVKKEIQTGNFPLLVGSQDLSPFDQGPFTGEDAAAELEGIVDLAILGHSERRNNFKETDEMVAQKVNQALSHKITPLVCVQSKETLVPEGCKLIAYEPPSSISTSGPNAAADDPNDAVEVARYFKEKYTEVEVLYGGSVTPENAKSYLLESEIGGVLVGGASLDSEKFIEIVESAYGV